VALHAFVTALGVETALHGELAAELRRPPEPGPRWPAVVTCAEGTPGLDPAFALQQLPDAVHLQADSVRALAEAALGALADRLEEVPGSFTVHAYVPEPRAYRTLAGRADLLGETFLGLLRERRRRLLRRYRPWPELRTFGEVQVVQLALVGRGSLLVSLAGGAALAPWPGGRAPIADDRRAPSRAYRKLREAFAWMAGAPGPGETCVDLGGAPGGWAWTALQGGARVVAVDRAPLLPPAAGHPDLTTLTGDAFSYRPDRPVDWLLCDVICRPERTAELCETWMASGWCRQLVATIKLKGRSDDQQVTAIRRRLARQRWGFLRLKHLANHHNEVAILARREPVGTGLS
jgi:23S rRNA (cytidine2498-2'-O)-methyltransferase